MRAWRILSLGDLLPADGSSRRIDAPDPITAMLTVTGARALRAREAWSHDFEGRPALTLITAGGWITAIEIA